MMLLNKLSDKYIIYCPINTKNFSILGISISLISSKRRKKILNLVNFFISWTRLVYIYLFIIPFELINHILLRSLYIYCGSSIYEYKKFCHTKLFINKAIDRFEIYALL